jgi:multimeric flavodoxin WrbA
VRISSLKFKACGCTSCRMCQESDEYQCAINDDARPVLTKMVEADVILMATPLYFFAASAQLKVIMDRMFSLYKWDNESDLFTSPLKGKTLALVASAYESDGLDALEKPFKMTADYTEMKFKSLLVSGAGTSGDIAKVSGIKERATAFGRDIATGNNRS